MPNEKTLTDQFVRREIEKFGVDYEEQVSSNIEIKKALRGASKQGGKGIGKPEFVLLSNGNLLIIEDKLNNNRLIDKTGDELNLNYPSISLYAVNGAVHYAKHIVEKTTVFKEVIAIGITGNQSDYEIQPVFVSSIEEKIQINILNQVKSIQEFHPDNIEEWYNVNILGYLPKEQKDILELQRIASELHEDLRNYGSLEGENKATVVSALLLALKGDNALLGTLIGSADKENKDGDIIYNSIRRYLNRSEVRPKGNESLAKWSEKISILLNKFSFIRTNPYLNTKNDYLGVTPLKYFASKLKEKVMEHFDKNTNFDILGHFYGEFVRYGGNDGNPLGIVLTPRHITSLMVELIDIQAEDVVLDPACGSAGFLISAMNSMIRKAENNERVQSIKQNQLIGIEMQEKLFTVATTNMILRGDGKSNLQLADMFKISGEEMKKSGVNKLLFNPPYSQAKTKELSYLSEISFIKHALEMINTGGKLAVIIPQSTMVGKTKNDKQTKAAILENNTLETVITLNKNTFYGIGVNPCIAVFTAGRKHPREKQVQFINFENDGYVLRKHVGLVPDNTVDEKVKKLINTVKGNVIDLDTKFCVRSTIDSNDEWLHSFYYFNDDIPSDDKFEKTIANYLSFKFDMQIHGRGYLFESEKEL